MAIFYSMFRPAAASMGCNRLAAAAATIILTIDYQR
jgi:hypothetical protein